MAAEIAVRKIAIFAIFVISVRSAIFVTTGDFICIISVLTPFRLGFLRVTQLGGGGGGGKCPRSITLKLLTIMT